MIPNLAVVVSHSVSNFDQWKRVFDSDQTNRKQAGILGHHINCGADDHNQLAVYLPGTDRAQLEAFLANPELKATMSRAGVTSAPSIKWVQPVEVRYLGDRATAAAIIAHEVEDFAAWKAVYDSLEGARQRAGIIGSAVNRGLDNPNQILVYHQAETRAELEAFFASSELKSAMQKGGVKGAPDIRFVDALPGATY